MNLYSFTRPDAGDERLDVLLRHGGIRIERIVSNRAATEWYDQEEDEWVLLLEGRATLQFDDATVELQRGDSLLLKAHVRHRVVTTSDDALWLAVFSPRF